MFVLEDLDLGFRSDGGDAGVATDVPVNVDPVLPVLPVVSAPIDGSVSDAPGIISNPEPPITEVLTAAVSQPVQSSGTGVNQAPDTPEPGVRADYQTDPATAQQSSAPTSQIFMGDPTRPGSGYIMVNGQPRRIMGTTAAGLGAGGQPKPVTANDRYILDDGTLGPYVNPADYDAWVNGYHAPNTYTAAEQKVNNTPPDRTERYLQNGIVTDAAGNPLPQYNTGAVGDTGAAATGVTPNTDRTPVATMAAPAIIATAAPVPSSSPSSSTSPAPSSTARSGFGALFLLLGIVAVGYAATHHGGAHGGE